ncbi:hypothetical protein NKI95_31875 [Mesorhizobium sp. M0306]
MAAVGDIRRFREPQKLVSYFGRRTARAVPCLGFTMQALDPPAMTRLIWVQEHQNVWSELQGEAKEAIGETAQRASVAKRSPRQTVYSAPREVHSCPDEMQKTRRPDGQRALVRVP